MEYHKKLAKFFSEQGISNVEISKKVDYSPVMVGRFLRDTRINIDFITAITNAFPEIDWNFIFKDNLEEVQLQESESLYSKSPKKLLQNIEENVKELRKWHESDTEKN